MIDLPAAACALLSLGPRGRALLCGWRPRPGPPAWPPSWARSCRRSAAGAGIRCWARSSARSAPAASRRTSSAASWPPATACRSRRRLERPWTASYLPGVAVRPLAACALEAIWSARRCARRVGQQGSVTASSHRVWRVRATASEDVERARSPESACDRQALTYRQSTGLLVGARDDAASSKPGLESGFPTTRDWLES